MAKLSMNKAVAYRSQRQLAVATDKRNAAPKVSQPTRSHARPSRRRCNSRFTILTPLAVSLVISPGRDTREQA